MFLNVKNKFVRLVVESAAIKEDGVYTLTASNNHGETVATATLKVHGKKLKTYRHLFFKVLSKRRS